MNFTDAKPLFTIPADAIVPAAELYTVHDSTTENVAAVVDRKLPWVIRHNGQKYRTILHPRYGLQAEADCAALGLNHAAAAKATCDPDHTAEVITRL